MHPEMEVKDITIVKILNEEQKNSLEVNDIVVFKEAKGMITHRIVKIEGEYITTKGDANNTNDDPIKKQDVVGEVVNIIPKIGVWEKVFTTPKVYIAIVITITLWGITFLYKPTEKINLSRREADEKKDDKRKKDEDK